MIRSLNQISVILLILNEASAVCNVDYCTNGTRCTMSPDMESCDCTRGFYGDDCSKDANMVVMCGKDFITISASEDFFDYHNVPLEALHLPNKSCRAQREVLDGVPSYMVRISQDKYILCGGKRLQKNTTHISYALSLVSDPQRVGSIVRDLVIKIEYSCVYPYVRTISLPYPVISLSSETVLRVHELEAKVHMSLYTDQTYTTAHSRAPSVQLREKVYVEVRVTEPEGFFLVQVDECWATQTPQPSPDGAPVHMLVQNGCASDDTVVFLNHTAPQAPPPQAGGRPAPPGANGVGSTVRYSFLMFRFLPGPPDLYLHCSVRLCEPDDAPLCAPNCKSVMKRAAVRGEDVQGLLSYGPIMIEVPDRPQTSVLLTVVLPVTAIWTVGFFIIVLISVAKAGNRRLAPA